MKNTLDQWKDALNRLLVSENPPEVLVYDKSASNPSDTSQLLTLAREEPAWAPGRLSVCIRQVYLEDSQRGQGIFSNFLDHLESLPQVAEVGVSNITDPADMLPRLRKRGYSGSATHQRKRTGGG